MSVLTWKDRAGFKWRNTGTLVWRDGFSIDISGFISVRFACLLPSISLDSSRPNINFDSLKPEMFFYGSQPQAAFGYHEPDMTFKEGLS